MGKKPSNACIPGSVDCCAMVAFSICHTLTHPLKACATPAIAIVERDMVTAVGKCIDPTCQVGNLMVCSA